MILNYHKTVKLNIERCVLHCHWSGNTKGGSITVPLTSCLTSLDKPVLTSCLTSLDKSVLQIKTKIVSCHTADSKPFKQEVNCTVILPPLVFPALIIEGANIQEFQFKIMSFLRMFYCFYFSQVFQNLNYNTILVFINKNVIFEAFWMLETINNL